MEKISKRDLALELADGSLDILFAKEKSHESAVILSNLIKGARGIIEFVNEDNKMVYGVLYNVNDFGKNNGSL